MPTAFAKNLARFFANAKIARDRFDPRTKLMRKIGRAEMLIQGRWTRSAIATSVPKSRNCSETIRRLEFLHCVNLLFLSGPALGFHGRNGLRLEHNEVHMIRVLHHDCPLGISFWSPVSQLWCRTPCWCHFFLPVTFGVKLEYLGRHPPDTLILPCMGKS